MDSSSACLEPGQTIKPNVSLTLAKELVEIHYGLKVNVIRELNSYDDKNFYVKTTSADGREGKYTFKVLNSMDTKKPDHIKVEHSVMKILSEKGINCPVPLETVKGDLFTIVSLKNEQEKDLDNNERQPNESQHLIRLLSFVEGKIMHEEIPTPKLMEKAGIYIAKVQDILKNSSFSSLENHASVWMLSHVLKLEQFIYVIKDQTDRYKLVSNVLNAYRQRVIPVLSDLEKGVFHGDFNEQNIIIQPSSTEPGEFDVHGVIDFGDIQVGPYIFDLAIMVCYMMIECNKDGCSVDLFEGALQVLKGYCSIRKLTNTELEILRILIACRLCQSLVMSSYTYSLDPGNEYLLSTAKAGGWTILNRVWLEKSDEEMVALWKTAVPV